MLPDDLRFHRVAMQPKSVGPERELHVIGSGRVDFVHFEWIGVHKDPQRALFGEMLLVLRLRSLRTSQTNEPSS